MCSLEIVVTRDAIITCIVNTLTCLIAGVLVFSILGYMAHIQETTIDEVVNSGPGLVFLTYPDLVSAADIYLLSICIYLSTGWLDLDKSVNYVEVHQLPAQSVKV